MERLTEKFDDGEVFCGKIGAVEDIGIDETIFVGELVDKLAEYEQAEEDGLLLRLPCPIGTTVYIVNHYWIDEGHICGIAESDDVDCFCYKVYCDPDYYDMVALVEFNKTWFLTKAEAEQALAKMKGEK